MAKKPGAYGWDWSKFWGSDKGLAWSLRDLGSLDEVVEKHVRKRRVAVQAGGNLGLFPKRLSELFEDVYTFEPDPDVFLMLCHNCPERSVVRMQAALGDHHAMIAMSHDRLDGKPTTHEGTYHVDRAAAGGRIPQLCIDDLALEHCDLIYLDVEGCEYAALQGAGHTIAEHRPTVVVEINKSTGLMGVSPDAVRSALTTRGYQRVATLISDEVYVPREHIL